MEILDAIKAGAPERVIALLDENPALADELSPEGLSLVLCAAYYRHPHIARLIAERKKKLTIHEAAAVGDAGALASALDEEPESVHSRTVDGHTPLGLAAYFGHLDCTKELLGAGADVNAQAENAMRVAPLHSALSAGHRLVVQLLLTQGADPNLAQAKGVRPVHQAAHEGNVEFLKLLISFGADVNARADDGTTTLGYASQSGNKEAVRFLQSHGAAD